MFSPPYTHARSRARISSCATRTSARRPSPRRARERNPGADIGCRTRSTPLGVRNSAIRLSRYENSLLPPSGMSSTAAALTQSLIGPASHGWCRDSLVATVSLQVHLKSSSISENEISAEEKRRSALDRGGGATKRGRSVGAPLLRVTRPAAVAEDPSGHPRVPPARAPPRSAHPDSPATGTHARRDRRGAALLPADRAPTKAEWARLSRAWRRRLDDRIATLQALRNDLTGCIGCGCLSLQRCSLYNPEDIASTKGPSARYLLGDDPTKVVPDLGAVDR